SATRQFRMSPGGRMLNSLRSRPLEPPSSVTVTTAVRSAIPGVLLAVADGGASRALDARTYFFSPRRSVESPVPPPMATTRRERMPGCILSLPWFGDGTRDPADRPGLMVLE